MPTATVGQKIRNVDRVSNFLRVTGEGQKVLLRFASNNYAYEGKHFEEYLNDTGEKKIKIEDCPKINLGEECVKCDKFFELIKPNKELKAKQKSSTSDEEKAALEVQIKKIRDVARPFQVKTTFYYAVLKRALNYGEQPEATIFQASLQVRQRIEEIQNLGYDITQYDFTILCTKKLPNYYIVDRVDKERTQPLTADEARLLEEAKGFNLDTLLEGKKVHTTEEHSEDEATDTHEVSQGTTSTAADVSPEDIPF